MNLKVATITAHAAVQMGKRGIPKVDVRAVLAQPHAVQDVRPGRVVA